MVDLEKLNKRIHSYAELSLKVNDLDKPKPVLLPDALRQERNREVKHLKDNIDSEKHAIKSDIQMLPESQKDGYSLILEVARGTTNKQTFENYFHQALVAMEKGEKTNKESNNFFSQFMNYTRKPEKSEVIKSKFLVKDKE